jgi:hypothetical protein
VKSAPGPYAGTSDFAWITWRGLCISPRKLCPNQCFSFCDFLRWFGTDLEAGFVIYAENDPKAVFGVSLGVRKCTSYGSPRVLGCQYTWRRPQPRMRRCTGQLGGVRSLVSEGHQPQSALGVESAIGHDSGLSLGAEGARLV